MKYIKSLTFLSFIVLIFSSCEKVIEVDLHSADPRFVIEGMVTNGEAPHTIRITQTTNFDEDNIFPNLTNATVRLSDDLGNIAIMEPDASGIFINSSIEGVSGRTYYLQVEIEGQTFSSSSTMPEPVYLDSLYIDQMRTFGRTTNVTTIRYQDPPGVVNYYKFIMWINDTRVNSLFISRDRLNDGQEVTRPLPNFGEENELKVGDTVTVEMQSIDRFVFEYFSSLRQTINQSAATPANPVSNISGGALGFFSAHTVQIESIKVE